ncbi:hypothetical protein M426DRAFT_324040 [Hypoxylon sp. CI-4A]|nr:hypothetical protein M426DRAFT_324040 [Hypoxylon sp. CI-4A]
MSIYHVVLLKFKDLVPPEEVKAACNRFFTLGTRCVHPLSGNPYVTIVAGGKDNSPEGRQDGMTHIFISQFDIDEDRKYYLGEDPAHLEFIDSIQDLVEKIQVVDFTPGVF